MQQFAAVMSIMLLVLSGFAAFCVGVLAVQALATLL